MNKRLQFLLVLAALFAMILSACGGAPAADTSSSPSKPRASLVEFTGVIEAINGNQWVINGQNITVDPAVLRDGPFQVGDTVQVEAEVAQDGTVTVTRVETPIESTSNGSDDNSNDDNSNASIGNSNDNSSNSNTNGSGLNSNDDNSNDDSNSNDDDNSNDDSNSNDDNNSNDDSNSNDDDNSNDDSNSSNDDNSNDDDNNSNDDDDADDDNDNDD